MVRTTTDHLIGAHCVADWIEEDKIALMFRLLQAAYSG
jgi:hypothetical protein